jgi:PAS domain S-box-containing protein
VSISETSMRPVLVVDDDAVSRHVLIHTLTASGMHPAAVPDADAALRWLDEFQPSLILLDLLMPGTDGYSVLRHIRAHAALADVPVVVLTALDSDDEIRRIFAEGADDYVHKPFRPTELVARLTGQLRLRDYVERLSRRNRNAQVAVDLTQELASSNDIRPALGTVVRRIANALGVDRCSIVLVSDDPTTAHVVASSDDERLRDLPLRLSDYPEIQQVLRTAKTLVLKDTPHHPLLSALTFATRTGFRASALIPILHETSPLGVIFVRTCQADAEFADDELALVRTVANASSIAFSNAQVLKSLREETQLSTTARVEAEQRLQHFQRYVDFFESAADGMVVIDRNGTVLFANPRTREITGYSADELQGRSLESIIAPHEHDTMQRLIRGFAHSEFRHGIDIVASTKQGATIVLSITSNSVLHEDNAILLSLRDVTAERNTALALNQTKEFLERVIDSSADAIISTDIHGLVLLFNRAASRMFGYEPEQVIGRLNATALYPAGMSRSVLRRLVDERHGGRGRLKDYRVELVSRTGEIISASLSAAFIVELGRPVGMVGVFTDLRERLEMERNLTAAQDELREREKQAIVAELAGATAHELNQPLTSIIAYSELLKRTLPFEPTLSNAADVIIGEATRMAEIVRQIGRITKYETKSYVGEAKILDLDRASPETSKKLE